MNHKVNRELIRNLRERAAGKGLVQRDKRLMAQAANSITDLLEMVNNFDDSMMRIEKIVSKHFGENDDDEISDDT